MSARTQVSYLASQPLLNSNGTTTTTSATTGSSSRKLHRERDRDKGGNVLPNLNHANNMVIVNRGGGGGGPTSNLYSVGPVGVRNDGSASSGSKRTGIGRQGDSSSSSSIRLPTRIQSTLASVKERRHGKHPEDRSRTNVDEDGVSHDSEYVQFRTATPVHIHRQRSIRTIGPVDDDGSASSSSASTKSNESRFSSSPYTYTSTHRTTASTHYTPGLGTTTTNSASALPSHLSSKRLDTISSGSAYSIQPASSSHLRQLDYDPRLITTSSKSRSTFQPSSYQTQQPRSSLQHHHPPRQTTSSYQPPAPVNTRFGEPGVSLRMPPARMTSSPNSSLAGRTARMSLADQDAGIDEQGGSGYNQYASSRPPKLDGSALDAGVHGMKRSWDGFKLEMKFGVRKVKKNVERKILNL